MNHPERLVFAQTLEALLVRGVGNKLPPDARERLRTKGVNLDKPLLPAYPHKVWEEVLDETARSIFPYLARDEAMFHLGESTVFGLDETLVGRAMLAIVRLIGPARMVKRLTMSVKTTTNFAEAKVTELSPNEFELVSAPFPSSPEYMRGALMAAILISGAKNPVVKITTWDKIAERLVLRLSWDT